MDGIDVYKRQVVYPWKQLTSVTAHSESFAVAYDAEALDRAVLK